MSTRVLLDECRELVKSRIDQIVGLCQDLVRIPSPSGCEGLLAQFILASMQELDYDETWIDAAGNVIGLVRGGDGPTTMFNGHMDIVDAGNPDDWEHPPFEADVHEGHIWGRGSADMKGGLAAMISAAGLFKVWGRQPRGDVLVCAAGLEEVGGWGSDQLMKARDLGVDRAVVDDAQDPGPDAAALARVAPAATPDRQERLLGGVLRATARAADPVREREGR